MSNINGPWTDERIEMLKKLLAAGLSASQIASELNCGLSRNAVIGKATRLGLTKRKGGLYAAELKARRQRNEVVRRQAADLRAGEQPIRFAKRHEPRDPPGTDQQEKREAAAAERRAQFAAEPIEPIPITAVGFDKLTGDHCRWIVTPWPGPVDDLKFCGAPAYVDHTDPRNPRRFSFCGPHCRRTFVTVPGPVRRPFRE